MPGSSSVAQNEEELQSDDEDTIASMEGVTCDPTVKEPTESCPHISPNNDGLMSFSGGKPPEGRTDDDSSLLLDTLFSSLPAMESHGARSPPKIRATNRSLSPSPSPLPSLSHADPHSPSKTRPYSRSSVTSNEKRLGPGRGRLADTDGGRNKRSGRTEKSGRGGTPQRGKKGTNRNKNTNQKKAAQTTRRGNRVGIRKPDARRRLALKRPLSVLKETKNRRKRPATEGWKKKRVEKRRSGYREVFSEDESSDDEDEWKIVVRSLPAQDSSGAATIPEEELPKLPNLSFSDDEDDEDEDDDEKDKNTGGRSKANNIPKKIRPPKNTKKEITPRNDRAFNATIANGSTTASSPSRASDGLSSRSFSTEALRSPHHGFHPSKKTALPPLHKSRRRVGAGQEQTKKTSAASAAASSAAAQNDGSSSRSKSVKRQQPAARLTSQEEIFPPEKKTEMRRNNIPSSSSSHYSNQTNGGFPAQITLSRKSNFVPNDEEHGVKKNISRSSQSCSRLQQAGKRGRSYSKEPSGECSVRSHDSKASKASSRGNSSKGNSSKASANKGKQKLTHGSRKGEMGEYVPTSLLVPQPWTEGLLAEAEDVRRDMRRVVRRVRRRHERELRRELRAKKQVRKQMLDARKAGELGGQLKEKMEVGPHAGSFHGRANPAHVKVEQDENGKPLASSSASSNNGNRVMSKRELLETRKRRRERRRKREEKRLREEERRRKKREEWRRRQEYERRMHADTDGCGRDEDEEIMSEGRLEERSVGSANDSGEEQSHHEFFQFVKNEQQYRASLEEKEAASAKTLDNMEGREKIKEEEETGGPEREHAGGTAVREGKEQEDDRTLELAFETHGAFGLDTEEYDFFGHQAGERCGVGEEEVVDGACNEDSDSEGPNEEEILDDIYGRSPKGPLLPEHNMDLGCIASLVAANAPKSNSSSYNKGRTVLMYDSKGQPQQSRAHAYSHSNVSSTPYARGGYGHSSTNNNTHNPYQQQQKPKSQYSFDSSLQVVNLQTYENEMENLTPKPMSTLFSSVGDNWSSMRCNVLGCVKAAVERCSFPDSNGAAGARCRTHRRRL